MFDELKNDTLELTEDEMATVTGGEFLGACGSCGIGGFVTGPFISAFTNQNANTFAYKTALATSNANQNSFLTQWF